MLVLRLGPDTARATMHAKVASMDLRKAKWEPCACGHRELRPGILGGPGSALPTLAATQYEDGTPKVT